MISLTLRLRRVKSGSSGFGHVGHGPRAHAHVHPGVGDGIAIYNAVLRSQGAAQAYCPPEKVGLVDAQYVAIMKGFMDKFPKTAASSVSAVLIYALQDAFPCK